jgi:hypothetical protein
VKVSVRDVTAKCPACAGTEFESLLGEALRLTTLLQCSNCSAKSTYRELLDQIGEEAMRRANRAIEELKRKSLRPRKPKK